VNRSGARAALLAGLVPLGLGGCIQQTAPVACTALFAYITVAARDSGGSPVTGLTITDTVRRTGLAFTIQQSLSPAPGTYVVFDDNSLARIRSGGDSVRVAGTNGTMGFVADFLFDAPDGCHVRKVSGPDTVVAHP
jgi:hypothetical protein